jgi:ferredoxin
MFDYRDISLKRVEEVRQKMAEKPPRKIKLPKQLAVINQAQCTGCQACIQVCPVDCIEVVPGELYPDMGQMVEIDLDRCIGCKACVKMCPWDTIEMINSSESYDIANQWTLRSVIRPNAKDNIIWGAEEAAPEVVAAPSTETPEA